MKIFQNILCPVDFSDSSIKALQWGENLAKTYGAELTVLYVMHHVAEPDPLGFGNYEDFRANTKAVFNDFLTPVQVPFKQILTEGTPSTVILETSRKLDASLLIMGTRGLKGIAHKFLGSTTENVIRHSTIPVLTVSPECHRFNEKGRKRILVPLSNLEKPPEGYTLMRQISRELGETMDFFHVVDYADPMFSFAFQANPLHVTEYETMQRLESLNKVGARITNDEEHPSENAVKFGDAPKEILKQVGTGKYDFLMMVPRKSPMVTWFAESTVYQLISKSPVPVITV